MSLRKDRTTKLILDRFNFKSFNLIKGIEYFNDITNKEQGSLF
jgi:hypothetical protein